MTTAFSFILVLGLLIFVHELGHFLFAKLFGVRVLKFSLGFGPALFGKKIGDTEYVVSAIPLGGFVKMFGENPDEQDVPKEERKVSFAHKSVWQRFGIVFAGPAFNFIFPVLMFFMLFLFTGTPEHVDGTRVGKVGADTPAAAAGLQENDVIIRINDNLTEKWQDILDNVQGSGGKELKIVVLREEETKTLQLQPKFETVKNLFGEDLEPRYIIGIGPKFDLRYVHKGPVGAFVDACQQTWGYVDLTFTSMVKIAQRVVPFSELGGPILIAQVAGQQLESGWVDLFYFIALLSVNLGILNLLPIPILDGGHLMFLTIEAIRRRPLGERAQIIAQQVGLALLGTLMIFVFYNDIVRIITQWQGQ